MVLRIAWCERAEEITWHLAECCKRVDEQEPPAIDASLVVACLLRPWPGNVRELIGEGRRAAARAVDEARQARRQVEARDLDATAGMGVGPARGGAERQEASVSTPTPAPAPALPEDEIAEALRLEKGNVSRAARRLGIHRNKVRRWLEKHGVDRAVFGPEELDGGSGG